jgi:hypothetical protein
MNRAAFAKLVLYSLGGVALAEAGCSASQGRDRDREVASGGTAGDIGVGGGITGGSGGTGAITVDVDAAGGNNGECGSNPPTTISGTVYDPAGRVPLYNVVVYVPGETLTDIPTGAQCQTCSGFFSGKPLAVALTDTNGHFTLENPPSGENIPLVIQVGKWRREITVPSVTACADNPITDPEKTRLPRNQSEGHIPKIAIATGGSDALECLVRKIGISDSEFTTEAGSGRVHLFAGLNAATTFADGTTLTTDDTLWSDAALLNSYDMMLLSCTGNDNEGRTAAEYANVRGYADMGGRIFGSHWHHGWINPENAPYPDVVKFSSGAHGFDVPITVSIDTSFPKGQAFADWLFNVGASTTKGSIGVKGAEHSVDATVAGVSQQWIYGTDSENGNPMVQYFSFNTPIGAAECGRMVFSDLHVKGASGDDGKVPFPTGCTSTELSPQEKALEFMIFDLSSCVQPDEAPVEPPPIPR